MNSTPNAFQLFLRRKSDELADGEGTKVQRAAAQWHSLSDEAKKPWLEEAASLKKQAFDARQAEHASNAKQYAWLPDEATVEVGFKAQCDDAPARKGVAKRRCEPGADMCVSRRHTPNVRVWPSVFQKGFTSRSKPQIQG